MIEIDIKTWRCTNCNLDARDRDPSVQEHLDLYMSEYPQLKPNECVNCGTITQAKVTDPKLKTKMKITDSQADLDSKRVALEAEPLHKVKHGVAFRVETDEEKVQRVDGEVDQQQGLKAAEKKKLKADLMALPNKEGEQIVWRDELASERARRIDREVLKMKIATPEHIQYLRDTFEDK